MQMMKFFQELPLRNKRRIEFKLKTVFFHEKTVFLSKKVKI